MYQTKLINAILSRIGKVDALLREKGIGSLINSIPNRIKERTMKVSLLLSLSYLLAQIISSSLLSFFINPATIGQMLPSGSPRLIDNLPPINHGEIKNAIVKRNLFNADGKLPTENDLDLEATLGGVFDPSGPCETTTLPLALVGTIMMGKEDSLATLREKEYSEADIYKKGDLIVGFPKAVIYEITRKKVVINHDGRKECLEIDPDPNSNMNSSSGMGMSAGGDDKPMSGGSVILESAWVEKELGEGFSKVLQAARFVPNTQPDGGMNGFRVFSIDPQTIMSKIGLQNDDVITKVNDTNMKQPDQGFALYQSLQDERNITIHLLRKGSIPTTLNIKIK